MHSANRWFVNENFFMKVQTPKKKKNIRLANRCNSVVLYFFMKIFTKKTRFICFNENERRLNTPKIWYHLMVYDIQKMRWNKTKTHWEKKKSKISSVKCKWGGKMRWNFANVSFSNWITANSVQNGMCLCVFSFEQKKNCCPTLPFDSFNSCYIVFHFVCFLSFVCQMISGYRYFWVLHKSPFY